METVIVYLLLPPLFVGMLVTLQFVLADTLIDRLRETFKKWVGSSQ